MKLVLGGWLIVAPWVIGFNDNIPFTYNDVLAGVLLVILSGTTLTTTHRHIGTDL